MPKYMDYRVPVEMLTESLNRLHSCQLKRITSRSIDFIAGLENNSTSKLLKYDEYRKLWHQLTPYIQIIVQERIYVTRANIFGTAYSIMLVRKKKRKIY